MRGLACPRLKRRSLGLVLGGGRAASQTAGPVWAFRLWPSQPAHHKRRPVAEAAKRGRWEVTGDPRRVASEHQGNYTETQELGTGPTEAGARARPR